MDNFTVCYPNFVCYLVDFFEKELSFLLNRNDHFFGLMSKFCLTLVDSLTGIDRFFYRNWSIFHFKFQILSCIGQFFDRSWHIFLIGMVIFQLPSKFVWYRSIFVRLRPIFELVHFSVEYTNFVWYESDFLTIMGLFFFYQKWSIF